MTQPNPDNRPYRLLPLTARSRLDPRDYRYRLAGPVDVAAEIAAGTLPASVDLHALGWMPLPWDQGQEGSCTGHMEAAAMMHSYLRSGVTPPERFSPRYIYWQERVIEGDTGADAGAEPRDGWDALRAHGVCRESVCPYVPGDYAAAPTAAADADAAAYTLARYEALTTWQEVVLALGKDRRFVGIATPWFTEWFSPPGGVLPLVPPTERPAGGHALGICGYRTVASAVQLRLHNSWGATWGDGTGHAWLQADRSDDYLWERWAVYATVETQVPAPLWQPDPSVAGALAWQRDTAAYLAAHYPQSAGDLTDIRRWQGYLAAFAPSLAAYLGGQTKALPELPEATR